jgi:hypothetical protein
MGFVTNRIAEMFCGREAEYIKSWPRPNRLATSLRVRSDGAPGAAGRRCTSGSAYLLVETTRKRVNHE